MVHHRSILFLLTAIGLFGCGPSTPEAKVQARAAQDFNCSAEEITAKPLDAPAKRKFEASGCGREAVYVNASPPGGGDNWVLDSPSRGE
jgi:hypothetical protein